MELTQKDYDDRMARQAAGQATDEDLRLIKHYEEQGFSTREDSVGKQAVVDEPVAAEPVKSAKATRGSTAPYGDGRRQS
ncbi:MAG: hypothetical protein ABWY81_11010 [Jiangellaceae bacterium]